jgi:peptidoglycan/LPS O-acetylase OafA/YrhL
LGNALDTLRVAGTLLVLMYHASLTYLVSPMRLTLWPVYDLHDHVSMDVFAYWVNGFAMPLFFLAAGVSAPAAIESRGMGVFLKHRAGRLLRPLLFGCLTILPLCYLLTGYGLLSTGRCTTDHIAHWNFPPDVTRHLYGLGHLWFLEYLFLVCVIWSGCWWLSRRWTRNGNRNGNGEGDGWIEGVLGSSWRPLWLAVPTGLIFLIDTDTVLRVENDVIPNLPRVIHYLYFFAVGGWISRLKEPKARLVPRGGLYLGLAAVDFAAMTPLLLRLASAPLEGAERLVFVAVAALFPWLLLLGALGWCLQRVEGKGPTLRFLAESSFWVYIIHLPIVMLGQILLLPLEWPGPVKFLVISVAATALSLSSYEWIVRYSLIGEIVNGARKRLKGQRRLSPEFGWIATAGALGLVVAGMVWHLRVFIWEDNLHVVVPGKLYRSGQLKPEELRRLVRVEGLRTVVALSDGEPHRWIDAQQRLAEKLGISYQLVPLLDDRPPDFQKIRGLLSVLEQSPRPILVQGDRGLDPCAFASALALMREGTPPAEALDQFSARYTHFAGPRYSMLGQTLLSYQDWLKARRWDHSPDRLQLWANQDAPASSIASGARPAISR